MRTETELGKGTLSIGYAAAGLLLKKLGNLSQKSILLVGAGKIGELTLRSLIERV